MSQPATSTRATFAVPAPARSVLPVLRSLLGEGLEGRPVSVILTAARGGVLCLLTGRPRSGAAP
jgi:hypothetical protein